MNVATLQSPATVANANQNYSFSLEEEDNVIHSRITNDERPLRRLVKKFHNYTAVALAPVVPVVRPWGGGQNPKEEAREAFLVELASFQLSLKKNVMICEAEARQVDEYNKEQSYIEAEHDTLRSQIEELKGALEYEQMLRRRKIEYDLVAEKVNTLPSRAELELTIQALENDISAIRAEHETQNRIIHGQKTALDNIIGDLSSLRLVGRAEDAAMSGINSPVVTPAQEGSLEPIAGGDIESTAPIAIMTTAVSGTGGGEVDGKEIGHDVSSDDIPLASTLNPAAPPFRSAFTNQPGNREEEEDIEMGEVKEPKFSPNKGRRKGDELEEGEASDISSALSDPPDD